MGFIVPATRASMEYNEYRPSTFRCAPSITAVSVQVTAAEFPFPNAAKVEQAARRFKKVHTASEEGIWHQAILDFFHIDKHPERERTARSRLSSKAFL
jgi:hypothetical protein